jgi:tRNA pseudouridine55 synthase
MGKESAYSGLILIDKPPGITSHQVVEFIRSTFPVAKAGHLGTLDPFATGLLPVLLARATRLSQFLMGKDKGYLAEIRLGQARDTYDLAGMPVSDKREVSVDQSLVKDALSRFKGKFLQYPPPYSAKKVKGKKLYQYALEKEKVELEPKEVTVKKIELLKARGDLVVIKVHCSAGTYIRSIAHDLGQMLGVGGYLSSLRRVEFGRYAVQGAVPLDRATVLARTGGITSCIIPIEELLPEFPRVVVDELGGKRALSGGDLGAALIVSPPREDELNSTYFRVFDQRGELLALATRHSSEMSFFFHPKIVLK